jgi:hypothetical protein
MQRLGIAADPRYRTVEKGDIVEDFICSGWAYEMRADGRDPVTREAGDAFEQIVGLGLPFGVNTGGRRRFDPAEVGNLITWLGIQEECSLWETRFIATSRKVVREFHSPSAAPNNPPRPAALPPQRFMVTFRREFNLQHLPPGAWARLRLPLPIEDGALRDLTLQDIAAPDHSTHVVASLGRLDGRFKVPPDGNVIVAWTASFTAYPTSPAGSPAPLERSEFELYTRPAEHLIRITPRIHALADSLAGSSRDPWTAVQRFWDFMLDRLTTGYIHYNEIDVHQPMDWVLENGWYDCLAGSSLLVALCRARGIAARLVSGYMLYPQYPVFHYWAEFWDGGRGWTPVDTVAAHLSAAGRDAAWRDYFFGEIDYRMKTECLPRLFTGHPSIRFPPLWHIRCRVRDADVEAAMFDTCSGAPVYRDQVMVERVNATPL